MYTLGINTAHDASCCLLRDGNVVAAIAEERLTRIKHAEGMPYGAMDYVLKAGDVSSLDQIDCIVINQYQHTSYARDFERKSFRGDLVVNPSHHLLHACYAWAASGWDDLAILVVDGSGYSYAEHFLQNSPHLGHRPASDIMEEAESTFSVTEGKLKVVEKRWARWESVVPYFEFASLGHMYSIASQYIFGHMKHAGKTMGLASYGDPTAIPGEIVSVTGDGITVETDWIYSLPPRSALPPDEDPWCRNIAAKVQSELERGMRALARRLHEATGKDRLAISGGVALNGVANSLIIRDGLFNQVFVTPAASDCGVAIGAALYGHWQRTGTMPSWQNYRDFHGQSYSGAECDHAIAIAGDRLQASRVPNAPALAARDLADGLIVGWFEGGSEFGPRALGHRSILACPGGGNMKEYLNRSVKFREPFRPYAASVLEEQAHGYFELLQPDPFMLTVVNVLVPQRDAIASVCHVDQTCRVQTVSASSPGGYRQLIEAFFRLTGLPLILDTSLNVRGEPIVETPEDAINCFLSSNFDVLYLEGRRITKTRIAELSDGPCGHLIPCLNVLKQISCRQDYDGGRWSQPVHVVTTRTGHGRTVPKAQADVLAAIDGARSISQIAAELHFSTFEPVAEICEQLQADGLISFRPSLSLTSALEASS